MMERSGLFAAALALASATGVGAQALGPVDGQDLPPTEIGRVAVGMEAPDFRLSTLGGDTLSLSDFRGKQEVILVFYRGWW